MIVSRNWLLRIHNFTCRELVGRREQAQTLRTRCLPKQARVESYVRNSIAGSSYIEFTVVDDSSPRYRKGESFRLTVKRAKSYYARAVPVVA